jgi:hypothetical protein
VKAPGPRCLGIRESAGPKPAIDKGSTEPQGYFTEATLFMPRVHDQGPSARGVRPGPGVGRFGKLEGAGSRCGMCPRPATRTVLVVVAGFAFLKDLCAVHLSSLLDGAREMT